MKKNKKGQANIIYFYFFNVLKNKLCNFFFAGSANGTLARVCRHEKLLRSQLLHQFGKDKANKQNSHCYFSLRPRKKYIRLKKKKIFIQAT